MEEAKVAVSSDVKLSQEDIHKVCLERAEKFLSLYSQVCEVCQGWCVLTSCQIFISSTFLWFIWQYISFHDFCPTFFCQVWLFSYLLSTCYVRVTGSKLVFVSIGVLHLFYITFCVSWCLMNCMLPDYRISPTLYFSSRVSSCQYISSSSRWKHRRRSWRIETES